MRFSQDPLQQAWSEACARRGNLVLIAGAGDVLATRALADLIVAATRDGAQIHTHDAAEASVAAGSFELAAEAAAELRAASAHAPQLLLLPHCERAAPPSIRHFAFLGRELRDAAVLLVATRGDVPPAADPARERALADLARAGKWITLERPAPSPRIDPAPEAISPTTLVRPHFSMAPGGSHWTLARGERRVVLRDSSGLRILAQLVREPGRAWRALDLAERAEADAGLALDAAARTAYRSELAALREAGSASDSGIRDSEFLARTLARDTGLGGRSRRIDSAAERARVAVTQSLRRTLAAVRAEDAALARWLEASLRTGHECRFDPADD